MSDRDETEPDAVDPGEGADAPSLIDRTDLSIAVVILAISGFLYWVTTGFEKVADLFAQDVPPEFFPRLLIWTIVVLTLILPFEHLFLKKKGTSLKKERESKIQPMAFVTMGLLGLVVASINVIGTALALVFVCAALPVLWGERQIRVIVPYAIILPAAITLLFSYVLGVHFEPGLLNISLR